MWASSECMPRQDIVSHSQVVISDTDNTMRMKILVNVVQSYTSQFSDDKYIYRNVFPLRWSIYVFSSPTHNKCTIYSPYTKSDFEFETLLNILVFLFFNKYFVLISHVRRKDNDVTSGTEIYIHSRDVYWSSY